METHLQQFEGGGHDLGDVILQPLQDGVSQEGSVQTLPLRCEIFFLKFHRSKQNYI